MVQNIRTAYSDNRERVMPPRITKWLAFKPPSESASQFSAWMYSNSLLIEEIEAVLEKGNATSLSEACQQMHTFYKSDNPDLKHFVIYLLPSLLSAYFAHIFSSSIALHAKKSLSSQLDSTSNPAAGCELLESCLLSICSQAASTFPLNTYSSNVADSPFCIPDVSVPSIFHDATTESKSIDYCKPSGSEWSAQRLSVYSCLCRLYADTLSLTDLLNPSCTKLVQYSILRFCKFARRLTSLSEQPRMPAASNLLIDLLVGLDMILFKVDETDRRTGGCDRSTGDMRGAALDAIEAIQKRAAFDCMPTVLLTSNAILSARSSQFSRYKRTEAKKVGTHSSTEVEKSTSKLARSASQDVAVLHSGVDTDTFDPSTEHYTQSRNYDTTMIEVITNASFRPKTVPEDITLNETSETKSPDQKTERSGENVSNKLKSVIKTGATSGHHHFTHMLRQSGAKVPAANQEQDVLQLNDLRSVASRKSDSRDGLK